MFLGAAVAMSSWVLSGPPELLAQGITTATIQGSVRATDGTEHLIRYGPAGSVGLPAEPPTLRPAPVAAARRYQLALALRELARRREPDRVELVDGTSCDGTIESVGPRGQRTLFAVSLPRAFAAADRLENGIVRRRSCLQPRAQRSPAQPRRDSIP